MMNTPWYNSSFLAAGLALAADPVLAQASDARENATIMRRQLAHHMGQQQEAEGEDYEKEGDGGGGE